MMQSNYICKVLVEPWADMAGKQTKALHPGKAISFLNLSAVLDKLCFTNFLFKQITDKTQLLSHPGNYFSPQLFATSCQVGVFQTRTLAGTSQVQLAVLVCVPATACYTLD